MTKDLFVQAIGKVLAGVVLMGVITCVNIFAIRRNVNRNFYSN